jgi:hypothetical protein
MKKHEGTNKNSHNIQSAQSCKVEAVTGVGFHWVACQQELCVCLLPAVPK